MRSRICLVTLPFLATTIRPSFCVTVPTRGCSVPTIDGKAEVKVKAGTQPGDKLRMRGYGVKMDVVGQRGRRGDQYVRVMVRVPRHLTAEQRRALEMYTGRGSSGGGSGSSGGGPGSSGGGGSTSGGGGSSSCAASSGDGKEAASSSDGKEAEGSRRADSGPAGDTPGGSKGTEAGGSSGEHGQEKLHRRSWRDWFSSS